MWLVGTNLFGADDREILVWFFYNALFNSDSRSLKAEWFFAVRI